MKASGEDNLVFDLELNLVLVVFEIDRCWLQVFVVEEVAVLNQSHQQYY